VEIDAWGFALVREEDFRVPNACLDDTTEPAAHLGCTSGSKREPQERREAPLSIGAGHVAN
jgi:hypothetical protein